MMKKTTLALTVALAATGIASPAFAQSYNPGDGTANALPFAYGAGAIKQRSVAVPPAGPAVEPRQLAARDNGRHLYAFVPSAGAAASSSNDPAATGGGSTGYNEMLLIH
jgi:hypothetical protein